MLWARGGVGRKEGALVGVDILTYLWAWSFSEPPPQNEDRSLLRRFATLRGDVDRRPRKDHAHHIRHAPIALAITLLAENLKERESENRPLFFANG